MRLLVVAGEASSDLQVASLVRELRKFFPDLSLCGVGGPQLEAEGMTMVVRAEELGLVGLSDWWGRFREVLECFKRVVRFANVAKPDLAILSDLPDFNLKLARKLKRLGVPVVYYISPQVWAWRKYRVRTIRKYVDKMLVLFPFEKRFYDDNGVPVARVPHPLLQLVPGKSGSRSQADILKGPRIALLPGSRKSELKYHGALLKKLQEDLSRKYPSAEFKIPIAPTLTQDEVETMFKPSPSVELVEGNAYNVFAWADVAVVASGTAVLEAALVGVPCTLFYKLSPSTGWIIKHFIRYKGFYGMPNLLLGKEVVKEWIQKEATSENLLSEVEKILQDETYRREMDASLSKCRELLGSGTPSESAAQSIFQFWKDRENQSAARN